MPATQLAAHPAAWRALPSATRQAVTAAARQQLPAPDLATATAAVQYGRHVRRHGTRLGAVLAAVMLLLLGVAGLVGRFIPALPYQTVDGTLRDLVVAAFLAGGTGLIVLVESGIGMSRLIGANLHVASAHPAEAPSALRVGVRWPLPAGVIEVAALCAGIVTMPLLHNYVTTAALVGALMAYLYVGPGFFHPSTATIDADGLELPRWHARLPWSSVHAVTLLDDRRVRVSVSGRYRGTAPLPALWSRRVAAQLEPGNSFTITCREPEIVMWIARSYLQD